MQSALISSGIRRRDPAPVVARVLALQLQSRVLPLLARQNESGVYAVTAHLRDQRRRR
jgi:hypothetical protein